MVIGKASPQYDKLAVLDKKSRTIKNKLPVTWIGKLELTQDALVIFNCSAGNIQRDRSSLATMVSITIDSNNSICNAIPALKIEDSKNPPKCSVNLSLFLEKGMHRFEMKGTTVGETREPSKGELYYDYTVIAVEDASSTETVPSKKVSRKVSKETEKKVPKKVGKKTAKKKVAKKKTTKKKVTSKKAKKKSSR